MKEKETIKISLSSAIIIFLIIFLIFGIVIFGYTVKMQESISTYEIENEKIEEEATEKEEEEIANKLKDLDLESELVTELSQQIMFPSSVLYDMTRYESFNVEDLSDELVLKMGWSLSNDIELGSDGAYYTSSISKIEMEKSLNNIFGKDYTSYSHSTFTTVNEATFANNFTYDEVVYDEIEEEYVAKYFGSDMPLDFIEQGLYEAVKIDESIIELYVKIGFVDMEMIYDTNVDGDEIYTVYKSFEDEDFSELSFEVIDNASFFDNDNYDNLLTRSEPIVNGDLYTYVYTFELDENDNQYYFSGFAIKNNN